MKENWVLLEKMYLEEERMAPKRKDKPIDIKSELEEFCKDRRNKCDFQA